MDTGEEKIILRIQQGAVPTYTEEPLEVYILKRAMDCCSSSEASCNSEEVWAAFSMPSSCLAVAATTCWEFVLVVNTISVMLLTVAVICSMLADISSMADRFSLELFVCVSAPRATMSMVAAICCDSCSV